MDTCALSQQEFKKQTWVVDDFGPVSGGWFLNEKSTTCVDDPWTCGFR